MCVGEAGLPLHCLAFTRGLYGAVLHGRRLQQSKGCSSPWHAGFSRAESQPAVYTRVWVVYSQVQTKRRCLFFNYGIQYKSS